MNGWVRAEVKAVCRRSDPDYAGEELVPSSACNQALALARMHHVRREQAPVQKTTSASSCKPLVGTSGVVGRTLAPDPLAPSGISCSRSAILHPFSLDFKPIMNFLQPRLLARPLASSVRSRASYAKSAESTTEHKSAEPQRPRSGDEEGVSVRLLLSDPLLTISGRLNDAWEWLTSGCFVLEF